MKIDLKKITAHRDKAVIARMLFPRVVDPMRPFQRVCAGAMLLDSLQIYKLATYLGVPINSLFTCEGWGFDGQMNPLVLVKGATRAVFHPETRELIVIGTDGRFEHLLTSTATLEDVTKILDKK